MGGGEWPVLELAAAVDVGLTPRADAVVVVCDGARVLFDPVRINTVRRFTYPACVRERSLAS
jgi:hypothetical protein